jgi:hypothetical protein
MLYRSSIAAAALALALGATICSVQAWDESKYPNWKGQWRSLGGPMRFDESKAWGPGQQAPLTPEYQKIFEENLADQRAGGQGLDRDYLCWSPGMPRVTNFYGQAEIVITPDTIHILIDHIHDDRRIFTDGRTFADAKEDSFLGFSLGKWVDTDGDGKFDVLEVETRNFKGPRTYDTSGIPLHADNQTIVKEKIYLDKDNPDLLYNEVTTIDNALTKPWVVLKRYYRDEKPVPYWNEVNCSELNGHVEIGGEAYMISGDGLLMPTKKGQKAPDLRYFK